MSKVGGGGGGSQFNHGYYTPLYEKGIKKIENKSMESTTFHIWKETNSFGLWNAVHTTNQPSNHNNLCFIKYKYYFL